MSSLLVALQTAGTALRGFEKAIGVVQTNVLNASTAGYARQEIELSAEAYDPDSGHYGGLKTGDVESSRSTYANSPYNRRANSPDTTRSCTPFSARSRKSSIDRRHGYVRQPHGPVRLVFRLEFVAQRYQYRQSVISAASDVATQFQLAYEQLSSDGDSIRSARYRQSPRSMAWRRISPARIKASSPPRAAAAL